MVDRTGLGERFASDMSLEEPEVPLYETGRERQTYDEMANLYAIIMATEHLERAYVQDAVDQKTYTEQCSRLISQFGVAEHVLKDQMSTETFMSLYQMDCPRAVERLLVQGVPQSVKGGDSGANHVATVAETVQYFITTMDAVRLEQRYVDELQPLLSDLYDSLTRLPETPSDFEPTKKVQTWLKKLNSMRAVDEIEEEDARQLLHDLDSAYTALTRFLKSQSSS